ncbi:uncharacterized protein LOC123864511 isoform X2 [Maniola jurtina]|uniref:uncharacterized protein LOC123864511 isoform X2 n=1 Tax=Maniola jurtina TaxID=191418 RepID=UPI001E68EA3B|nr:uncharacterized protein LOC123864511 isoform X2 [Maniola jurtina]
MEDHFSETFALWGSQATSWSNVQSQLQGSDLSGRPKSSSLNGLGSIDAVREEFRNNGIDSPYDPEEEQHLYSSFVQNTGLAGMGQPAVYLRQKSWPAPDATPAMPIPRPSGPRRQSMEEMTAPSVPANGEGLPQHWTHYDMSLLNSIPREVIHFLLDAVVQKKRSKYEVMECRFCKKNGEKESYYRSHRLRWQGRITCPVLRQYRCHRCGAHGDDAHTLKYCPLVTDDERMKSINMMRSMRQSRRRNWSAPSSDVAGNYGAVNPVVMRDGVVYTPAEPLPLDPLWEALISKL